MTSRGDEDVEPTETHGTCPDCGHNGCLVTWPTNTYCHSCGTSKQLQTTEGEEYMPSTNTEYTGPKLLEVYKGIRSIDKEVCEKYEVTVSVDTSGDDVRHVYPYPHKDKYRFLPKDFSKNVGFTADHLFGMDKFNAGSSKFLTICEGELDVLSVYQMLGKKWPVVGLPSAGISKKLLMNCDEYIKSFDNIIVCSDNDDAGDKAAEKLATVFPNKVYRVQMSTHNDPNEFLEAGHDKDFLYAWINRKKYVPEFDTSTVDGYLEIFNEGQDAEYISTGIEEFDSKALGLVQGVLTVFQAPEGTGKTELFRYFEHHMIKENPEVPFAMCHLEESKQRSLLGLVSYDKGKNLTRKQLVGPTDNVEGSIKRLTDSENVHLFSVGIDEDPMVLVDRIKYYANVCECKYIFFEPIQDIAQQRGPNDGTTEQFLTRMSVQLSRVASETGCGIVIIAHENDDGLVRDCRMIPKQASVVVQLSRDMDNKDPEVSNITTLTIKKNRPASLTGYAGQVKFDPDSFTLEEYR